MVLDPLSKFKPAAPTPGGLRTWGDVLSDWREQQMATPRSAVRGFELDTGPSHTGSKSLDLDGPQQIEDLGDGSDGSEEEQLVEEY